MYRTRVGYTGGAKANPTYYSLGDHTETLQIEFDPAQISYEAILDRFWQNHNPHRRAWSTQYKAALFVHSEEQRSVAEGSKLALEQRAGNKVETEILTAERFYLAEDYHQKYSLQNTPRIWGDVLEIFGDSTDWIHSTAAARLNGYVGSYGKLAQLEEEIDLFGLSLSAKEHLHKVVQRFDRY